MNYHCRHCEDPLVHEVIDLGHQPPSNAYLVSEQLGLPEVTYPLKVLYKLLACPTTACS